MLEDGSIGEAQGKYKIYTHQEVKQFSEELAQIKNQINKRDDQLKKYSGANPGSYSPEALNQSEKPGSTASN